MRFGRSLAAWSLPYHSHSAMPYGLYISAAGAEAQNQRLQVLSHNLANVDTPGFKKELAILQARHSEAVERGEAQAGSGGIDDIGGGVALAETITDFAQGAVKDTGVPTDLAINSADGFFVVDKDGQPLLTRAGNFRFNSDGLLQTQQGDPVQGDDGAIQIDPTLPFRILETGVVEQDGEAVGRLQIVEAASRGDLARAGENYFLPLAPTTAVPDDQRQVLSGYLEQSSVSPTLAMMELIEASRAYESNIKLIQNQDQMLGSLLNRVLAQN